MIEIADLSPMSGVAPGFLMALLVKGAILVLIGVAVGRDCAIMPAVVRHRVALGAVSGLAALPWLTLIFGAWELPILPRASGFGVAEPSALLVSLILAYAAVTSILLLRLGRDVLGMAQLGARAGTPRTAAEWVPGLEHARAQTPVRVSEEIRSPLTWGWLRPQILLPADSVAWTRDELSMVLHHELAHVQRADWASHVLGRLVLALYWPLPGVRLLLRQLSLSAEQACDDRVLAAGASPSHYAEMLLRRAQGSRIPASVALGNSTELGKRIRHLVADINDHSIGAAGSSAIYGVCLALTLAVATAQLGQRPELPVVEWGSGQPHDPVQAITYPPHALPMDDKLIGVLSSGPARPQPPPSPQRPPQREPIDPPPVPPPG